MNLSTHNLFKNVKKDGMIEITGENLLSLQQVLLMIMDDIDHVCRQHNLKYMLGGGTALGAVRHSGFIPWDDDIDINMPRNDYNIFLDTFAKEMGDKYWVQSVKHTETYVLPAGRIRLKGTKIRAHDDINDDESGIYIDIFPIENTYNNFVLRKLHCFFSLGLGFILSCKRFYDSKNLYKELFNNMPEAHNVIKVKTAIGFCFSFFSIHTWLIILDRCHSICSNQNSKYVVIPSGMKHFNGELYLRHPYLDVIEADFENRKYYITKDFDNYLKKLYNNYMQIPPEEKREKHVVLEFNLGDYGK